MSSARYWEYKDSGVAWFGEVPEHWKLVAVRMLFELGRGRVISHEEISNNPGEYPVYSSQTENNGEMGRLATYDFCGDYLTWTTDGANAGTVFRRSGKFNCTNVCGTLKPKSEEVFLDYCVHALSISTSSFVRQDINPKLMNNVMAGIGVLLPPLEEQRTIAMYLSRELTKIDALVEEQEQLIALLKEKRRAVISHAVTKGLDRSAPMKDSGIEWLGEVPEHWSLSELGYVASEQGGKTPSKEKQEYWDGDIPWVSPKDMKTSVISDSIDHITPMAVDECGMTMIPENAVLVVVRGMILAHSFPVAETVKSVTINQDMKALIPNKGVLSSYLRLVLESAKPYVVSVLVAEAAHGTRVLRTDIWKRLSVLLPPQIEQQRIIEHVSSVSEEYERLVSQIGRGIDLLKERRSALITAAVTGKIDIRGLVAEEVTA